MKHIYEGELVKIRTAAGLLGVHDNTVRHWINKGKIGAVYLNGKSGHRRIPRRELDCAIRIYGKCFTCGFSWPTHRALTPLVNVATRRLWEAERAYCQLHAPEGAIELEEQLEEAER